MCPFAPRVCSELGGQKPVLSLSLDRIRKRCHWWQIWHNQRPNICIACLKTRNVPGLPFVFANKRPISAEIRTGIPEQEFCDMLFLKKILVMSLKLKTPQRYRRSILNEVIWSTKVVGNHYCDVIMGAMASQITSLKIVYTAVYSGADQRKHQKPASLAFVRGIHRGPVIPRTSGR